MEQTPIKVGQNFFAGMTGGVQAGLQMRQANDQFKLRNIFATQDINDPAVQQQIMGLDPQTGMQLQDRAAQREDRTYQRGRKAASDSRAEQALRLRLKESTAAMSEVERQQAAAQVEAGLMQAIPFFESGDLAGFNSVLQAAGEQPIASLDQAPAILRKYKTVFDALADVREFNAAPKPADEYGRYLSEEQAAGRQPLSRLDYEQAKKGKGTIVYDPTTGKPLVSIGGGNSDPTDASNPSSPAAMLGTIEGILNDPALDTATGMLAWTQNIPGTDQRRFGTRVKQLNGQAFLQAFESLKGAGQITEIEGEKATDAIGRLDSAQSPQDYRQALVELKDILSVAAQRPVGWAEQQSATPPEMPSISDQSGYDALPSGSVFIAPDGTQRRKP